MKVLLWLIFAKCIKGSFIPAVPQSDDTVQGCTTQLLFASGGL